MDVFHNPPPSTISFRITAREQSLAVFSFLHSGILRLFAPLSLSLPLPLPAFVIFYITSFIFLILVSTHHKNGYGKARNKLKNSADRRHLLRFFNLKQNST